MHQLADAPSHRRTAALAHWLLPAALAAVFAWAYWPTFLELVAAWERSPDYSHGYLVVPLALFFLWVRRDEYPGVSAPRGWPGLVQFGLGLVLLGAAFALRYLGARYRLGSVDGWSMIPWLAGVVWIFGGWRLLWWSAPSLAFLWFMVPLPFSAERMLSLPLQGIATRISTWTLQCLGQPAFAQGHVIAIGQHELEVAQACSGLRILVGTVALAFAYCVLIRRSWWKRIAIVLSTIPVALTANAMRIVATGLLYQVVSFEAGQKFSHDVAGWIMIPLAALLFAAVLWYLNRLFPEVEEVDASQLLSYSRNDASP
jgi:exosortase